MVLPNRDEGARRSWPHRSVDDLGKEPLPCGNNVYHTVLAWNIGLLIHGNDCRLTKIELGHRGIKRGNFALARFSHLPYPH